MFAAYSAEIFRAGLQGIDRGQTEAAISLGFTRFGSFRHIILPQLIQRILPVYRGEFISMVKNTSIVGYVAVQDLTKVGDIIRSRTFDAFFPLIMVTLIYLLLIWLLGQSLTYIERRTDPERRRRRLAA
jgi:polar amino acid transport system substrate-binding protein